MCTNLGIKIGNRKKTRNILMSKQQQRSTDDDNQQQFLTVNDCRDEDHHHHDEEKQEEEERNLSNSPDKKRHKPGTPTTTTGAKTVTTQPIQIANSSGRGSTSNDNSSGEYEQQQSTTAATVSSSPCSSNHLEKPNLPLWVAGSSPAKFVSLPELVKMADSVERMAIVHQIAIEPQCSVEDLKPASDPLYERVKSSMHRAYWDLLRQDLAKEPPNMEHAFQLLKDLKKMTTEHLESANLRNALAAVDEALDLDHLDQLLQRSQLNFGDVLHSLLAVLEKLCAPIRDGLVGSLKQEQDPVELFRGLFNLVELMQLDMANFTLSQNRQLIGSYSAKIEFDEFQKLLDIDKSAADNTRLWLHRLLADHLGREQGQKAEAEDDGEELSRAVVNELIVQFYVKLLELSPAERRMPFPETLALDQARLEALGEKLLQLELTVAALFVASNLAGKAVCEGSQFKAELKRDLLVILNDVDWQNFPQKLANVALHCDKKCGEALGSSGQWTEERSALLKQQIHGLANLEDSVRTIAKNRIREFVCQALRQTSEPLRIPLGLSPVQTELASLTSRFYAIATHNWNTFGRFYGKLLDEEHTKQLQRRNGPK